jgi:hypothetical protein
LLIDMLKQTFGNMLCKCNTMNVGSVDRIFVFRKWKCNILCILSTVKAKKIIAYEGSHWLNIQLHWSHWMPNLQTYQKSHNRALKLMLGYLERFHKVTHKNVLTLCATLWNLSMHTLKYMGALKWNPTSHKEPKVLVTTSFFALSIAFFQ